MYDSDETLSLVLEYVEGGDLMDYLIHNEPHFIPEREARSVTAQILDTLLYLHARGITHRDLKPENILITSAGTIKITDFGLAKMVAIGDMPTHLGAKETMLRTFCGTLGYLAPEVLDSKDGAGPEESKDGYDSSVDLWSVGCIVYTM